MPIFLRLVASVSGGQVIVFESWMSGQKTVMFGNQSLDFEKSLNSHNMCLVPSKT